MINYYKNCTIPSNIEGKGKIKTRKIQVNNLIPLKKSFQLIGHTITSSCSSGLAYICVK